MINEALYTTCQALTRELSKRGIVMLPKPGSMLQAAVTCANPLMVFPLGTKIDGVEDTNQHYRKHTVTTVNSATTEASPYESIIRTVAKELKGPVTAHIQYARNVVKPAVKHLYDKVGEVINSNPIREASETIEIVGYTLPEWVRDAYLKDSFNMNKRPCEIPLRTNFMAEMENEEIASLMKTGSSRLDNEIAQWCEGSNIRGFDVWASIFAANTTASYNRQTLTTLSAMNYYEAAGYFAIMFLIASNLASKTMFNKSNARSEGEYTASVEHILNYAAYRLDVCMREGETLERNNVVVLQHSSSSKMIKVIYPCYKKWTESGASADILLGAFATNAQERTIEDLGKKGEFLMRSWKQTSEMIAQVERRRCFDTVRSRLISEAMLDVQKNKDQLEAEFHRSHSMFESTLNQRITSYVNSINPDSLTNTEELFKHCLWIVGQIRFGFTPAYGILETIFTCTEDGKVDVREGASVATFHYLFNYMRTQLEFQKY